MTRKSLSFHIPLFFSFVFIFEVALSAHLVKRSHSSNIYFETDEIVTRSRNSGPKTEELGLRLEQTAQKSEDQQCSDPATHRYHKESGACHPTGKLGPPCGQNMLFYEDTSNTVYGDCDCKRPSGEPPFVYHEATAQCYPIYSQAYCLEKQWLVFNQESNPVCEPRRCAKPRDSQKTLVYFKGKCVLLNSSKSELCQDQSDPTKTIIGFPAGEVHLGCLSPSDASIEFSIGVRELRCAPGTKRDIVGKCRAIKNVIQDIGIGTTTAPDLASTTKKTKPTRRPRPTVMIHMD